MMYSRAIETVGRPTLLIKGTKVVGSVSVQGMRGDEFASISLDAQLYDQIIKPLCPTLLQDSTYPAHKLVCFRFIPFSGLFLDSNLDHDTPEWKVVDDWFDDCLIVDEFNLGYKMVPDWFKEVEGYGAKLTS